MFAWVSISMFVPIECTCVWWVYVCARVYTTVWECISCVYHLCLCVCLCVSLCMSINICCMSVYVWVHVYLWNYVSMGISMCVSVFLCMFVYVSVWLFLCASVCVCLCEVVYVCFCVMCTCLGECMCALCGLWDCRFMCIFYSCVSLSVSVCVQGRSAHSLNLGDVPRFHGGVTDQKENLFVGILFTRQKTA